MTQLRKLLITLQRASITILAALFVFTLLLALQGIVVAVLDVAYTLRPDLLYERLTGPTYSWCRFIAAAIALILLGISYVVNHKNETKTRRQQEEDERLSRLQSASGRAEQRLRDKIEGQT